MDNVLIMSRCDVCMDLEPDRRNVSIQFSDLVTSAQQNSCSSCRLLYNGIVARKEDKIFTEEVFLSNQYGTLSIYLLPFSTRFFAERGPGNSTPERRMFFHVLPGIYPNFI
jgi:hypothetical protein